MATAWVVVATAPAQVETAVVEVKDQVVLAVAVRVVGAEEVRVTELLDSAVLALNYGVKYGLVGRNGVGKTTLLRHLAEGLIPLPKFLNVVHVEQEITGDERSAIATILEADKEREWLLKVENLLCEAEDGDAMEKALNIRWLPLSPSPHHNPDPSPTLPGR